MDLLDFSLVEDSGIPGRLYFQVQSGNPFNQCHVETFGSLCIIRGRMVLHSEDKIGVVKTIPFECALDGGDQLSVRETSHEIPLNRVPQFIVPEVFTVIKATQFPSSCPVESITLEIICGNFNDVDEIAQSSRSKSVLIIQCAVKFKSYDTIKPTGSTGGRWKVAEILFDHMVLMTAAVSLPKSSGGMKIDFRMNSPPSTQTIHRPSLLSQVQKVILRKRIVVEILIFMALVFAWTLLVRPQLLITLLRTGLPDVSSTIFVLLILVLLFTARHMAIAFPSQDDTPVSFNGRSFFVNGWQSWSFCGSILHGEKPPIYSMPNVFVRAFHDGGVGTSLPINLGQGKVPFRIGMRQENPGAGADNHLKKDRLSHSGEHIVIDEASNRDHVASDMFTMLSDLRSRYGVVVGFLSQRQQFGCISTNINYDRLTVHISGDGVLIPSHGGHLHTDPLVLYSVATLDNPFSVYMTMSGRTNDVSELLETNVGQKVPVGWCSWYHFYEKISENILLANMDRMKHHQEHNYLGAKRLGFNLFQIDDGYQLHWGDWTEINPRYAPSRSLQDTVKKLSEEGFLSGLWLAPFSADKGSNIAKKHPEWILRKTSSMASAPCNSANCGKWFYGFDVTNPAFQEHVKEYLRVTTRIWGFRYLKLDFLYSAALHDAQATYYDRTLTKAQIMQVGMRLIRDNVGDSEEARKQIFILGCGSPLGSVLGHVHANRISADMGLSWNPDFPLPSYDAWNLPCARNAVRNTLTRLFMHKKWWINDPDCLLLRDKLAFTDDEIIGIASVKALCGGSIIISDDFDAISSQRMRIAQRILPPTNQAAVAIDLCHRETPELLRLVMTSSHSKAAQMRSTSSTGNPLQRHQSEGEIYYTALTPSNDEFFPWDAGMNQSLYESFSHAQGQKNGQQQDVSESSEDSGGALGGDEGRGNDSGSDSPSMAHYKSLVADPGAMSPPLRFSSPEQGRNSARKQYTGGSSSLMISAHKHMAEREQMHQIRAKFLDKRDLLKRWYVFSACHWTETSTYKDSAATASNILGHEHFYVDSPSSRSQADILLGGNGSGGQRRKSFDFNNVDVHIDPPANATSARAQNSSSTWFNRIFGGRSDNSTSTTGKKETTVKSKLKTHFVHIRDIFGEQDVEDMLTYTRYLYRHQLKRRQRHLEKSFRNIQRTLSMEAVQNQLDGMERDNNREDDVFGYQSHTPSASKPPLHKNRPSLSLQVEATDTGSDFEGGTPGIFPERGGVGSATSALGGGGGGGVAYSSGEYVSHSQALGISHVLHCFQFWTEQYSYKVVTLDDEEGGEVAFTEIPYHSAHIYSLNLSLHPLMPRYIGSNLHFTCGQEVRHVYLMEPPIELKRGLEALCHETMTKKKSRSNVFASPTMASSRINSANEKRNGGGNLTPNRFGNFRQFADQQHGGILHSHSPKVQCMRIDFEEGTLKDAHWGGKVWVFLPVNIHSTRLYPHVLGRVQLMGDAIVETHGAVEIVEYIEETTCLTAGYIYKIPVCLPRSAPSSGAVSPVYPVHSPNGKLFSLLNDTTATSQPDGLEVNLGPPAHHVIISWISDMMEN